jgi:hypothetical protein
MVHGELAFGSVCNCMLGIAFLASSIVSVEMKCGQMLV